MRFLCAVLFHPWLKYRWDADVKTCPCGKSSITRTHLVASFPGDYVRLKSPV